MHRVCLQVPWQDLVQVPGASFQLFCLFGSAVPTFSHPEHLLFLGTVKAGMLGPQLGGIVALQCFNSSFEAGTFSRY